MSFCVKVCSSFPQSSDGEVKEADEVEVAFEGIVQDDSGLPWKL